MSVQDIIYITPDEFRLKKDNATCCQKTKELYSKLLTQYDCFTKPDLVLLKFPTTIKPSHKHGSPHSFSNQHDRKNDRRNAGYSSFKNVYGKNSHYNTNNLSNPISKNRPQLKALANSNANPEEEARRHMKGFMNIINRNNYSKILHKVRNIINNENIEIITDIILDTACCQVFYVHIFYKLLKDITEHIDESAKAVVHERVTNFIDSFIGEEQFMSINSQESKDSKYMQFCLMQKHKSLTTARNLVVLELLTNRHSVDWDKQTYFDFLLKCVIAVSLRTELSQSDQEQNIDTLLCMLKDIKSHSKELWVGHDISEVISNMCNANQRIKFMIQDIMASG